MDWNDLVYFLAAYRERSLGGAARRLGCEHTTVSRRLGALETSLGTRLFTRTPDGLAPTEAADAIVPFAEEIEQRIHAISRAAAGADRRIEGTVRLSTSETFAAFVIKRLGELRARHPELVVEVIAENRVVDVARGEADLALRFVGTTHKDLVVKALGEVNWALYAAPAYLAHRPCASSAALRGHDVIGYDDSLASTPGATWLAAHADGATIVVRGNSLRAVLDAALAGLGLAVLPCHLADATALVRVSPEALGSRTLCLVVHPDLAKVARVRAVIDFVSDVIARDRAELLG